MSCIMIAVNGFAVGAGDFVLVKTGGGTGFAKDHKEAMDGTVDEAEMTTAETMP